ncbi:TadE/TadG family type IV pilus assembly protein [Rhizobium sp. 18065]|uniref:TadE/TadG family type IV pilus assembly protein n=1 Tax=Rhizobium sp. 18065 TaxID=2681411 RepID=UPI00135C42F8|nr:TadE/TadG family type IV pilus assembly protein [Rhizobium sp. 18065]
MIAQDQDLRANGKPHKTRWRLWKKLARSRDGAAAIEFAILSIPYFMIVFAIIETFVAFTAEQLVTNAVNTLGRQLRTGEITHGLGRDNNMDKEEFRAAFCDEVSILINCSAEEIATPSKLYIDARTFATFAEIPNTIPRISADAYSDIDPTTFAFTPGGPTTINMLRAYYRWQVITDLIRPYITTIRPADGSMPSDFLIVATTAFQNENYP